LSSIVDRDSFSSFDFEAKQHIENVKYYVLGAQMIGHVLPRYFANPFLYYFKKGVAKSPKFVGIDCRL